MRQLILAPALSCLALPALAQITAEDVWTNTVAYYAAIGGTMTGNLDRQGEQVFVEEQSLKYVLPQGFGQITLPLPPMTLTDEADGTVTMASPKTFDVVLQVNIPALDINNRVFSLQVSQADYVGRASGTPGDITYEQSAAAVAVTGELVFPEVETGDLTIQILATNDGYSQTSRITEGDLITYQDQSTFEPIMLHYEISGNDALRVVGEGNYGRSVTESRIVLPAGGSDIMNLAPAFAAGMMLESTTVSESISDITTTYQGEGVIAREASSTGANTAKIALSAAGFNLESASTDLAFSFLVEDLPGEGVSVSLDEANGALQFPIQADKNPQTFAFSLDAIGATLDEGTWAMFDPGVMLPRDPADMRVGVDGLVVSGVDLFDFAQLESIFERYDVPVLLQSMNISALSLSAVGAAATASGAFTFDNTDLETYDGMPRPVGSALLDLKGAYALIDRLVALGALAEDEAGMARLSLGMFTRATGDDQSQSTLEMGEDGQVRVNGQRIR